MRQGLSPEAPLILLCWIASKQARNPPVCLTSAGITGTFPYPAFSMDPGDPNSGPHACRARTLATEPSPHPT